jgi:hypothetical protein
LLIRIKSGLFFRPFVTGKFIEFLLIGGLPLQRLDKHLRMSMRYAHDQREHRRDAHHDLYRETIPSTGNLR